MRSEESQAKQGGPKSTPDLGYCQRYLYYNSIATLGHHVRSCRASAAATPGLQRGGKMGELRKIRIKKAAKPAGLPRGFLFFRGVIDVPPSTPRKQQASLTCDDGTQ